MAKVEETSNERELKWQTEEDFSTLINYEKLIKDPKRVAAAKKLARTKQNELMSILKTKKED